ncbi:E3 ubiquitin-protein ligase RGLG4 [Quercus suber]|uniref:E3 ubiquitin-protein ligase RGLG4 n=1 Tax=Quercus suber TaxID=58331 RepID=UPI0032DFC4C5
MAITEDKHVKIMFSKMQKWKQVADFELYVTLEPRAEVDVEEIVQTTTSLYDEDDADATIRVQHVTNATPVYEPPTSSFYANTWENMVDPEVVQQAFAFSWKEDMNFSTGLIFANKEAVKHALTIYAAKHNKNFIILKKKKKVLSCYKKIVPNLRLAGPTSYAPVVEAAIDIVEKTGGQYHVLVLIADGQVTRSVNTSEKELSPQEEQTIKSIVNASSYPLSIVLVGVGDGPWDDMRNFDDKIPAREFDNFQFVNFTAIMSKDVSPSEKETAFALAALMEIPIQYQAARELGILGRATGRAKKIVPRPPPVPYSRPQMPTPQPSSLPSTEADERNQAVCPICLTNAKDLAFGCGHLTCQDCGARLSNCPICRQPIRNRLRVFTG